MVASQDLALKLFFRQILVLGGDHLPHAGPVLLAPTHRSRWDALLLPHAAGRRITGRDCRFMVTVDEMRGLQGWLLHRLGCFPVHQGRPSMASLRYPLDLLSAGHQLVVFPEGQIQRQNAPLQLHRSPHGNSSRWSLCGNRLQRRARPGHAGRRDPGARRPGTSHLE
jgi:1-acyl-sn-glycerol-3-phosphate acyltransferase